MKKYMFLLLCLFILSCGEDDDPCNNNLSTTPIPPTFLIAFEDSDGTSLIGTTFVQDSFKLRSPTSTVYLKPIPFGPPDQLVVWMSEIINGNTYFLELSETEIDTLIINHSIKQSTCSSNVVLDKFTYNSEILYEDSESGYNDLFIIIKE